MSVPSSGSYDPFDELKRLIDAKKQQQMQQAPMHMGTSSSGNFYGPSGPYTPTNGPFISDSETFSVGDEIEIVGDSCFHMYPIGTELTIERISGNDFFFVGGALYAHSIDMKKKKKIKKAVYDPSKMDALIIEQKVKDEIVAVLNQYKNHDKLFKDWGLGEVIEYGRGMTFMFYGSPGTGKTWGATCIAKAFGVELLTVSAAEIQSSEPGGANRAIQEAFKEAKAKGKVLFLDECDSFIASRNDLGMVLASEVNTLLTEIEKFEGVAILATNRIEHMDEALERRISLIVEFPKPDLEARKKIWTKLLPAKMPLGKGVSIDLLAVHELTGGQIKNIVLHAARMAVAGDHEAVELKHFDLAISRLNKSKNLMGSASRYRQGIIRDDYDVSSGISKIKRKGFKDFLKTPEDEQKNS